MYFRVRTRLTDTPGALARLAQHCGDAGVNILAMQIYPELGSVIDDLVVEAPGAWTVAGIVDLVGGAGGDEVSVVPCATHELLDQPTAWLRAAAAVLEDPSSLPGRLTALLGPRVSWSATEQVRAQALSEIADLADAGALPPRDVEYSVVEYERTDGGITARIGGHVVGAASLWELVDGAVEATLEVAPAWRRTGIGRQLLLRAAGLAVAQGAVEMVMTAPPTEEGVVPLLAAAGMRGRIKLTEDGLTVRVGLSRVRPWDELVASPR